MARLKPLTGPKDKKKATNAKRATAKRAAVKKKADMKRYLKWVAAQEQQHHRQLEERNPS